MPVFTACMMCVVCEGCGWCVSEESGLYTRYVTVWGTGQRCVKCARSGGHVYNTRKVCGTCEVVSFCMMRLLLCAWRIYSTRVVQCVVRGIGIVYLWQAVVHVPCDFTVHLPCVTYDWYVHIV